ncbi:MAG: hypothetical protein MJ010_04230 [Paludibacteraceae bacterium]|nr:hypothetical protein [Paludibacteraceae bacterium]
MNTNPMLSHIESLSGLSVAQIRSFTPEELRSHLENKNGKPFQYVSEFPVVGRGNVLRDGLYSREDIDRDIDKILALQ